MKSQIQMMNTMLQNRGELDRSRNTNLSFFPAGVNDHTSEAPLLFDYIEYYCLNLSLYYACFEFLNQKYFELVVGYIK